jgi:ABC-type multidrug transport system fused ATPase/permease subunit
MFPGQYFTARKVPLSERKAEPPPTVNAAMGGVSARGLYRYIWRTSRPGQIAICLLTAIIAPLSMVMLEIQRRLIDDAVGERSIKLLIILGAAYVVVICFKVGLKYALDMAKGRTVETVARDLRLKIMKAARALRRQKNKTANGVNAGTIVSMLGVEAENMSGFAGDALSLPLLNGGTVLSVVGYLVWVEPLIAVLALIVYFPQLLIVPATQFTINRLGRIRIRLVRNLGHLAVHDPDHRPRSGDIAGRSLIDRLYRVRMWIYLRKFFLAELGNFLDSFGPVIVLTVGGYLAIIGETQVSTIVVFISGLQKIADPWDQMITFYRTVSNTAVMYEMIRDKLGARPAVAQMDEVDGGLVKERR